MKDLERNNFSLMDRIRAQASGPNASLIAIEDDKGGLTYAELIERVTMRAAKLPDVGDGPRIMAVHGSVDRCFVETILAIWMRGHVVMPIDETLPHRRKKLMLERPWIELVILASQRELGVSTSIPMVSVLKEAPLPSLCRASFLSGRENAAYVTFSSGTTGSPKAILGRSDSLSHFIDWQTGRFGFDACDVVPVLTSPSFDPYLREVLAVLQNGGKLRLIDPALKQAPHMLMRKLAAAKVTRLHGVPTLARHWFQALSEMELKLTSLKTVFFAGERLSSRLVEQWHEVAPNAQIVNLYGPSETTLARFYDVVTPGHETSENLSVGKSLPDSAALILDHLGEPVADGDVGEVFIDTAFASFGTVETGWIGVPSHEAMAKHGPRLYPTGDLGRFENGKLRIEGRADTQSKIAGIRFHPKEISDAICSISDVSEAEVIVDETGGTPSINAVYVLAPGVDELTLENLRRSLSKRLLPPLIPSCLAQVDALPVTENGKVDRATIAEIISKSGGDLALDDEQCLTAVIESVKTLFELKEIPERANFFTLGGDSILATRLAEHISTRLGRQVAPGDVLIHPSFTDLANFAAGLKPGDPVLKQVLDLTPAYEDISLALSQRQLAYMAVCMAQGDADWCILSRVLDDIGPLSDRSLRAAVTELAKRHDVLRMQFPKFQNDDRQELVGVTDGFGASVEIETYDFEPLSLSELDTRVSRLRAEGSKRLFDLETAPLIRFAMIKAGSEQRLIVWVHHLIMDGPSLNLFTTALRNQLRGSTDSTSGVQIAGYRDFISWQSRRSLDAFHKDGAYWSDFLMDYKPLRVNERRREINPEGYTFTRPFAPQLVAAVQGRAKEWQCTSFVVLLAGFLRAIAKRSGNNEPAIIVPMQAKGPPHFSETIGLFFTMAMVRMDVKAVCSDGGFTSVLQQQLIASAKHCEYEFHKRMQSFGALGDPYFFPLTTALFNQNRLPSGMSYNAATPMGTHALGRSLRFQIQGEVQVKDDDFLISYLHRETAFADEGGIEPFADLVETEIGGLVG